MLWIWILLTVIGIGVSWWLSLKLVGMVAWKNQLQLDFNRAIRDLDTAERELREMNTALKNIQKDYKCLVLSREKGQSDDG